MLTTTSHRWYAVQTTAGHENKVRTLLQRRIDTDPTAAEERQIRQVMVPTQTVVEVKNGKKVEVEKKTFPGYVLVEMVVNQDTQHTVNGLQGVIKFVGKDKEPAPLRDEEVKRLLGIVDEKAASAPVEEIPFLVGQAVQISEGLCTDRCRPTSIARAARRRSSARCAISPSAICPA